MDAFTLLALGVAGFAAGVASGLFGVGGGVLMVPAALYLVARDFHFAKAASLVVIVFSAGVGVWTHAARRSVDWRAGALLALGGALGTVPSVVGAERVSAAALTVLFALLLAGTGLRLASPRAPPPRALPPRARQAFLLLVGVAGGLLAGAFGIGGGVVMVPGLLFAGLGIHAAVGTSLLAVLANAIVATGTHAALGYGSQLLLVGTALALGAVPGTHVGAVWAHRLDAERLRRRFGLFLALVAALLATDAVL